MCFLSVTFKDIKEFELCFEEKLKNAAQIHQVSVVDKLIVKGALKSTSNVYCTHISKGQSLNQPKLIKR